MRRLPVFACLAVLPVLWLRFSSARDPLPTLPRLMLWAWESPQDLRFVKLHAAGIAFLARTVWLDGTRVQSRPRLQPLRFNPGTELMGVVRFESRGTGLPPYRDVVRAVMPAAEIQGVTALQIDFDARQSERPWYRGFLQDLRPGRPRAAGPL